MATVLFDDEDISEPASREDFSVIVDAGTGKCTLIIPSMAVDLSCEGNADTLVGWVLRDIDIAEMAST